MGGVQDNRRTQVSLGRGPSAHTGQSANPFDIIPPFPGPTGGKFVDINLRKPVDRLEIEERYRRQFLSDAVQRSFLDDFTQVGLSPSERRTIDELVDTEYRKRQSDWVKTTTAHILTQIFVEIFNGQSDRGARYIDTSSGEARQMLSMPDVIQPYVDLDGAFLGHYLYELKTTTTSASPAIKGQQLFNYFDDLAANRYMGAPVAGLGYVFVRYARKNTSSNHSEIVAGTSLFESVNGSRPHKIKPQPRLSEIAKAPYADVELSDLPRHEFAKYIVSHISDMTIVPSNLMLALYATGQPLVYEPKTHHVMTAQERGTKRLIKGGVIGTLNRLSDALHDEVSSRDYLKSLELEAQNCYARDVLDGTTLNTGEPLPLYLDSLSPRRFMSPKITAECGTEMVGVKPFTINYFHFRDQDIFNRRVRPMDVLSENHSNWLDGLRQYHAAYMAQYGLGEFLPKVPRAPERLDEDPAF